jgi:hypothetical protein
MVPDRPWKMLQKSPQSNAMSSCKIFFKMHDSLCVYFTLRAVEVPADRNDLPEL